MVQLSALAEVICDTKIGTLSKWLSYALLRLVIYTVEFVSEFCVEFVCRILLSKVTNKVSESGRNLEIESEFRRKFDSRWPTLLKMW